MNISVEKLNKTERRLTKYQKRQLLCVALLGVSDVLIRVGLGKHTYSELVRKLIP